MNGVNGKFVKIVAQTGLAGITVLTLIGAYFLVTNHLNHSIEAMGGVEAAVEANTVQVERLEGAISNLNQNILYLR